uniref:Uncharacterized protein n=1 Tax=Microcebus murinus TaxID=30608 RepID=A0A8C6EHK1_MICMU
KDATATPTLRTPVRFWRNTLTAKSCPGLKGLAWASWSPVIQRCSPPCSFSAACLFLFQMCFQNTQTTTTTKNTLRPTGTELHLLRLETTPPTTKPVPADSGCLHVCF